MATATLYRPEEDEEDLAAATPRVARVLHLINGEHYAGAERVQDLLALRLGAFGYDPGFACLLPGRFPQTRCSDTPLIEFPMRSRLDLRPVLKVARLIRRGGYDLLHTHTPRTAMVGRPAAALAGVPLVHHVHGQTATEVGCNWRQRVNTLVEGWSVRGAAAVIAVSETAGNYMVAEGLPADRVCVVPNGIPPLGPLPRREPPGKRWTLGIVGLLRPRKGLDVLLQALAALKLRGHDLRLRAVGPFETPEYEALVRSHAAQLELEREIDWRGFQSDVEAELAAMDALIFPSVLPEGMPLVVLEAMAAGVPLVASRVDGVTDVLRHDREAMLVNPGDAAMLAAACERLLRDGATWQRLREAAHQRQTERFSDQAMAAGVAEVYRRVLE